MKRYMFVLILLIGMLVQTKADTIDFWHVYYNETKIVEFHLGSYGEVVLQRKDIAPTDSLTIVYYRDTSCDLCQTTVSIEDENGVLLLEGLGMGSGNPAELFVFNLAPTICGETCYVYYRDERSDIQPPGKVLLFRLKIE